MPVGAQTVYAHASDTGYGPSADVSATYTVYAAPTVTLVSPANNTSIAQGANVFLQATATAGNAISKVEFFTTENANQLLGTATATPYQATFNLAPGTYHIYAKVTDWTTAFSATNALTVTAVPNSPTVLLLHMDSATFADTSPYAHAMTPINGASLFAGDGTSGGASLAMNTGGYLSTPAASEFSTGTGDFTYECYVKSSGWNVTQNAFIVSRTDGVTANLVTFLYFGIGGIYPTTGSLRFNFGDNGTNQNIDVPCTLSTNTWHHVAAVRCGNIITFYADGVALAPTMPVTGTFPNMAAPLFIGANNGGSQVWNGRIDEVRITKAAVYTANFTPPVGELGLSGAIAQTPGFTPNGGTVATGTHVYISTPIYGCSIAWRLDAGAWNTNFNPAVVNLNTAGNHTLTAFAIASGYTNSPMATSLPFTVYNLPIVSLVSPGNGAWINQSDSVLLQATATAGNIISKVEFFTTENGNQLIGTATAAPYQANWTPNPGGYHVYAKVTDWTTAFSATNLLQVNAPPVVSAGANQSITFPASATLQGTVSDDGLPLWSVPVLSWSKVSGPGEVAFSPVNGSGTNITSLAAFSTNGVYTLRLTASDGELFASNTVSVTVNPFVPYDTVWVEDALPAGATGEAVAPDGWNWTTASPAPYSGSSAHRSAYYPREHQHSFTGASPPLYVGPNDLLYCYLYLDYVVMPMEVMLQWHATDGTGWEHRAYWGMEILGLSGVQMAYGVPAPGSWVRLEVPAYAVDLAGKSIDGMAFCLYAGSATWDRAGVCSRPIDPANRPPSVNAGPDQAAVSTAVLNGWAADDGRPAGGILRYSWSKVSGPGTVTFASPNSATTSATFSAYGEFVLRLSVSDCDKTGYDEVTVTTSQDNGFDGVPKYPALKVQITTPRDKSTIP